MASTSSRPASRSGRSRSQSRSRANSRGAADYGDGAGAANGYAAAIDGESDFCNAFWESGQQDDPGQDRGYESLMGRMKNAGKMVDDFRSFFKERAAIEEDYARRLAKLARMPLGKDETGDLSNVLRRVQYELDQSGRCHNELANVIRQTLEARVKEFEANREQRRRNTQIAIERAWKNKQQQEGMVQKGLEKYKADCILINSFSARLSLTQGRDMDKVTAKLDKARQTVQTNEAEYKNYLKALKDTQTKWIGDWKAWCDLCQDMEEERLEFTRNALWSYVNALSLICVKDDESCENVRQVVEICDVRKDLQRFVHREGGGSVITDTPQFMDFSDGDKGSIPPATQQARFARSSAKVDQPPFDGLERLQAAIYPQQNGGRPKSVALSQAPTPATQTPAVTGEDADRRQANTPARGERAVQQAPNNDLTPQQASTSGVATSARDSSPTKTVAQSSAPERASIAPPNPPPSFNAMSRSRPASRASDRAAATEPESMQTTAERLQHQASQKRLSDLANPPPPNPNYPYASSQPKTAKPFVPDAAGNADLRQSPSAMLPPASSAAGGPGVPAKKPEAAKEDPLLAALAKLRSPSSAVDVLPPTSPGIPGGTSPAAVQAVRLQSQQSQQQLRSQSPYGQQPGPMDGRKSPSMPAVHSQQQQQYAHQSRPSVSQQYPLPGQGQYGRGPMAPSQSQPAYMNGSMSGSPAPAQYTQARSRPASPNPQARAPSPSAAMMRPPSAAGNPDQSSSVAGYGQAFPGERRQSIARPNNLAQPGVMQGSQSRPSSPAPQVGGQQGAALRSPPTAGAFQTGRASPAPGQNPVTYPTQMRSPSPGPPSAPGAGYAGIQQGQQQQYGQPAGYPQGQQQGYPSSHQQPAAGRPQSAYQPTGPNQGYMRPTSAAGSGSMGHRPTQSYGGQTSGSPAPGQLSKSQPGGAGRPTTPLGGGISLDASGQVTQDAYARPGQQPQQQYATQHPQASLPAQQQSAGFRHGASIYRNAAAATSPAPGQQQNRNSMTSPAPQQQQQAQPMSPSYTHPQGQPSYNQPPQQAQQQGYQRAQSPYVQQPQQGYGAYPTQQQPQQGGMRNSQSMGYDQQHPPQQQQYQQGMQASQSYRGHPSQQQPQQQMYTAPPQQNMYQQQPVQQQQVAAAPSQQPLSSPSPRPPTGQYTESGHPILFYVKAIYKYDAASLEEFSFQKDDVIGVFETDDDGWWKGELLDPERARRSGGNVFPSNFTTFLD